MGKNKKRLTTSSAVPCSCCASVGIVWGADATEQPACLKPLQRHKKLKVPQWLSKNDNQSIWFCAKCGTLWYRYYIRREGYYDYTQLPKSASALLRTDAPLSALLAFIKNADTVHMSLFRQWIINENFDVQAGFDALFQRMMDNILKPQRMESIWLTLSAL